MEYLNYLRDEKGFSSLRYGFGKNEGFSIMWNTSEGFPFQDLIGIAVNYDGGYPTSVQYAPKE